MSMIFIFAGLPGTGKTTLSQQLARHVGAVHLRIDTIEQGLRDLCDVDVEGQGYRLAYRIAADNLRLGQNVVADSCNPTNMTRREWEQTARDNAASFVNIEVHCSNRMEHQHRVESRIVDIPGLRPPTWRDVQDREYHEWSTERIVIDTAGCTPDDCLRKLLSALDSPVSPQYGSKTD